MKKRKLLVVVFFLVVFGLPVAWYLFLQAFGENQFVLPVLGNVESSCDLPDGSALVLLDRAVGEREPNQKKRLKNKLMEIGEIQLIESSMDSCKWNYEMSLIDHEGVIRGIYDFNREEVDRFLAEVDIYMLNYQNGTSAGTRVQ